MNNRPTSRLGRVAAARDFVLILVTVPDVKTARTLARAILTERLAACVNVIPGLESHFWWQGKLDRSQELLLLIKTRTNFTPRLQTRIGQLHPYDTPEFLVLPLKAGSSRYLAWLWQETSEL